MNKDEMKMIKEMAEMLIDAQDKCENSTLAMNANIKVVGKDVGIICRQQNSTKKVDE